MKSRLPGLLVPACILLALVSGLVPGALADRAHVDSLNSLGHGYIFSNIEHSVRLYRQVTAEARALDYQSGEAVALQLLGVALYLNGQYEEGVKTTLQAIRRFEELGLGRELALAYGELGYEMKRRDLARAVDYMRRGINIAETSQDSTTLCALYDNYGVLQEMADQPDSAAFYYRRALNYKTALDDSLGIPFSLNNLCGIAAAAGRMAEAERLLRRSDAFRQAMSDSFGLVQNNVQWGELLFMQGDLNAAAERYQQSLRMPGIFEHGYMVSFCYERLAAIYEQMPDFEQAYRNLQNHTAYRDSLSNVEINARLAALELEFDTERKDHQLAENKLAITARSRQILGLLAVIAVLLVAGVGVARYQHLKRRQIQQEMELRGQLRRAQYEQRLADEKLRISRDLHDNIGSQLTFMTSSIDNISYQESNHDTRQELDTISEFGRATLDDLRLTVWAMKNEDEGFEALEKKLADLKQKCNHTGRPLEFKARREPGVRFELTSDRLLNLYRVAQEAIQNSLKHTQSGTIRMQLTLDSAGLSLSLSDEGPGFPTAARDHIGGLANMRQRCRAAGGEFELASDAGGTRVVCRFPAE